MATIGSAMKRQPLVALCLLYLLVLVLFALFPSQLAPFGSTEGSLLDARHEPGRSHLFGSDAIGRGVFSRVIHGTRISLAVSVLSVALGLVLGGLLGLLSGYLDGVVDSVIMRLMDVMMAFPGILLAVAIIAARGPGIENLVIAIGIAAVPDHGAAYIAQPDQTDNRFCHHWCRILSAGEFFVELHRIRGSTPDTRLRRDALRWSLVTFRCLVDWRVSGYGHFPDRGFGQCGQPMAPRIEPIDIKRISSR